MNESLLECHYLSLTHLKLNMCTVVHIHGFVTFKDQYLKVHSFCDNCLKDFIDNFTSKG